MSQRSEQSAEHAIAPIVTGQSNQPIGHPLSSGRVIDYCNYGRSNARSRIPCGAALRHVTKKAEENMSNQLTLGRTPLPLYNNGMHK